MIFSNVSNDINDDGAEDANGGEDCQSGFTAFLGRHIGLPVGQGFGFGGDAAGGDGRDVRAHLVFGVESSLVPSKGSSFSLWLSFMVLLRS